MFVARVQFSEEIVCAFVQNDFFTVLGLGFVLFSGVSIIPRVIRLDDVIMRLAAAVYLRKFSPHFRHFSKGEVAEIGHRIAWVARAFVIVASVAVGEHSMQIREKLKSIFQSSSAAQPLGSHEIAVALWPLLVGSICVFFLSVFDRHLSPRSARGKLQ